jgi:multidrug efflux pump subunit AcrB
MFVAAVWLKLGASGTKEVVIQPDVEKLKARGLTVDQLGKAVKGKRFVSGQWTIRIDKNELDLTAVAKLTVRELQAPPFTVDLHDGREVVIMPIPERIGHYVVTGEYFEQDVRGALANFSEKDPGKIHVLGMILVPGTVVPHLTEENTMRHFSVGEPLETFAKVKVREKPAVPAR